MTRTYSPLCALIVIVSPLACDPGPELEPDSELAPAVEVDADAELELDDSEAPDRPDGPDALTDVTRESKFVIQGWSHTWHLGQPNRDIGSTADQICWLIEAGGDFEGDNEEVGVWDQNGRWILGGASNQASLMATAHCIPRNYWGQTLSFERKGVYSAFPPKDLGPADGRVCFLSYFYGKFKGGGEVIQTYIADGHWWISATTQQGFLANVGGTAVCLNTDWRIGPFHWTQGQPSMLMASAAEWVCGLSRVTGKFEGYGEKVRTPVLGDGNWYLTGTSQQAGVGGSAFCI